MLRRFALPALVLCGFCVSLLPADEPTALLPSTRSIPEVIDHYIDAQLKAEKLTPAPLAADATLLRRLILDLAGRIPMVSELDTYLASRDPQKKMQLVDRLLAAPGFVRHQTQEFAALLATDVPGRKGAKKGALQAYLQKGLAENRPWDRIFRELMLPDESDPKTQGSSEFLKSRIKDLNRLTIDVSTVFFGVNVSCAQCHDHPHVRDWTQDQFYGMKSFFARTYDANGVLAEYDAGQVKYTPNKGTEKIAPVMFLTGKRLDLPNQRELNGEDRKKAQKRVSEAKKAKKAPAMPDVSARAKLVETALAPDQRMVFARSIVNRLWHRHFGRGLVMPLDQMHAENPPSHPELLDWLARDLVEHGYDLRRLIRGIVLSNAYARSSRWDKGTMPQDKFFAVAQTRPLTPMQMAVSLRVATASQPAAVNDAAALEKWLAPIEKGAEGLANLFPRPSDNFQVGVGEAMLFANNADLQKQLFTGNDNLIAKLLKVPSLEQRADLAVRAVLCRPAQPTERKVLTEYLRRREDRAAAGCQQVVWALLTSAEFRFNH
jgi:hypothetical protein